MTIVFNNDTQKARPVAQKAPPRPRDFEFPLMVAVLAIGLLYAFTRRNEGDWTAETGLGYGLGITGGLMMLALLIYPLRKRMRALQFLGAIPGWFRIHMLFGVLGPALVIVHANFSLGSMNSRAAMISMLVVAGSGFIGRFLYSRIHRGLYGQKQSVIDQLGQVETLRNLVVLPETGASPAITDQILESLRQYQAARLNGKAGFALAFWRVMTGPVSRAIERRKLISGFQASLPVSGANAKATRGFAKALDKYFMALGRAEAFSFYERAFAYWHLLHLPLFVIMIFATFAHIIAVHLY
jgi:hypothetical protein